MLVARESRQTIKKTQILGAARQLQKPQERENYENEKATGT